MRTGIPLQILAIMALCIITSCSQKVTRLQLLTDDPYVMDAAFSFNANQQNIQIIPELFTVKGELYSYSDKNMRNKYDILAGAVFPHTINLNKYHTVTGLSSYEHYIPFLESTLEIFEYRLIPYRIEALSFITRKPSAENPELLLYEELKDSISKTSAELMTTHPGRKYAIVPELSPVSKKEYYFLSGNPVEMAKQDHYKLNSHVLADGFMFFRTYSSLFTTKSGYESEDLMKRNKVIYELQYISQSALPSEYTNILIKDKNTASLKQYCLAIQKSSGNKQAATAFIHFLLSENVQNSLVNSSIDRFSIYKSFFVPVIKSPSIDRRHGHIKSLPGILAYTQNLLYPQTGNQDFRNSFFRNLDIANDLIDKERLKDDDFIKFMEDQMSHVK